MDCRVGVKPVLAFFCTKFITKLTTTDTFCPLIRLETDIFCSSYLFLIRFSYICAHVATLTGIL
jgi:hypothetical protein